MCELAHTWPTLQPIFLPPRVTECVKISRRPNKCNKIWQKFVINQYNSLHLRLISPKSGWAGEDDPDFTAPKRETCHECIDQILDRFSSLQCGCRLIAVRQHGGVGGHRRLGSGIRKHSVAKFLHCFVWRGFLPGGPHGHPRNPGIRRVATGPACGGSRGKRSERFLSLPGASC
jgi:hypothetical protein